MLSNRSARLSLAHALRGRRHPAALGVNVIGRHLSRGRYHIYPGTLSGSGHDMLGLWRAAAETLMERGYYINEEDLEDMQ